MTQATDKKNLTLKEAAEWYGVSERSLRRRIDDGSLRAWKIGPRSIRVAAADVEALARPVPAAHAD
jgi:excisionase family DNA binding protein